MEILLDMSQVYMNSLSQVIDKYTVVLRKNANQLICQIVRSEMDVKPLACSNNWTYCAVYLP